jgi:hypothetical protein
MPHPKTQYAPGQKVFSFTSGSPTGNTNHRPVLWFPPFPKGDSSFFPVPGTSLFNSINAAGLVETNVKFEFVDHQNIAGVTLTGVSVPYDTTYSTPLRYRVEPATPFWSRVTFEVTITSGNADNLIIYATDGSSNSNLDSAYLQAIGVWNSDPNLKLGGNSYTVPPSIRAFSVEIYPGSCTGTAAGDMVTFNLKTTVVYLNDTTMGGECNTHLDCIPTDEHGPAPHSNRVHLSANGNPDRFRRCVVQDSGVGRCTECYSDCDCEAGQYCHADRGTCYFNGVTYVCDPESANLWGTCQWKDPEESVFGRPCQPDMDLPMNTTRDHYAGFCGRSLYYNETNLQDPTQPFTNVANTERVRLWTGLCVDLVCIECAEEADISPSFNIMGLSVSGTCDRHFTCADGFLTRRSGNSLQGAVTQKDVRDTRDASRENAGLTGATLFFIIVITLTLAVGIYCMMRKGGSSAGKSVSPAPVSVPMTSAATQ